MMTAVWWIRRDLRLADNPALADALAQGRVVPLFILDPLFDRPRDATGRSRRFEFMLAGLRALAEELARRGSALIIRRGEPVPVLKAILQETGAQSIHAMEDYSPYARRRDSAVADVLPLKLLPGIAVRRPGTLLTKQGGPYTVYTPFWRAWRSMAEPSPSDCLPVPARISSPPRWPASELLPETMELPGFAAGEKEAQRRLARFLKDGIAHYGARRDLLAVDGTSTLSPYLRFGMLSPREAAVAALSAMTSTTTAQGAEIWLKELVWRDFYLHVLWHFPAVMREAFNPGLRGVQWREAPADLAAWQQGLTGYPVVDACMRQLNQTGWMHNRGRMIVASFLAKDLLLDWRAGEAWFMRQLIDGDPAANNGGWQWAAGTGTDAAPYFRIFNPVTQGEKFDPEGEFVRRYVPELAGVPTRFIHHPWDMPTLEREMAGLVLGRDYPWPVVDRAVVKPRTLAAYKAAKEAAAQA